MAQIEPVWNMPQSLECPNCGAALDYDGTQAVVRCSHCDSSVLLSELPDSGASELVVPPPHRPKIRLIGQSYSFADVYTHYLAIYRPTGPVAEVAELLATEEVNVATLQVLRGRIKETGASRKELLGLALYYLGTCAKDHQISDDEKISARAFFTLLKIREGEFYQNCRDDVAQLLRDQILHSLVDGSIEQEEAIQQVELQRLLGLSASQYEGLVGETIEKARRTLNK